MKFEYPRGLFLGHYKLQGASFTQGTISSISIGGSISSEGFLPSILLLVVVIVTVVVVIVILIVVVVDDVSLILKLSFEIIGVPVGLVFLLGLLALAIVSACAFRAEEMPLVMSCWMVAKVMAGVSDVDVPPFGEASYQHRDTYLNPVELDNVVEEEDGERIRFLGGNNSSGTKKYRGSNSSDGGNTGDGIKIAGGVIGSGDEIESSEEVKEMLPDEAGK
ncbi:hypothetical protein Tco_0426216 [Tanacetum coccineum]